jgi:hypothetical protein
MQSTTDETIAKTAWTLVKEIAGEKNAKCKNHQQT